MQLLEIWYGCIDHLIHCAGSRMIAQGTDQLSQGSMEERVMLGEEKRLFPPLNKTTTEVYAPIKD
eukprot:3082713-Ditylum_brightwellii.AAC.1